MHIELLPVLCFVFQNVPLNYHVVEVKAEDKDEGVNGRVEFEFVESLGSLDWRKFKIDRYGGNVTTDDYIDREEQEMYYVSSHGNRCVYNVTT